MVSQTNNKAIQEFIHDYSTENEDYSFSFEDEDKRFGEILDNLTLQVESLLDPKKIRAIDNRLKRLQLSLSSQQEQVRISSIRILAARSLCLEEVFESLQPINKELESWRECNGENFKKIKYWFRRLNCLPSKVFPSTLGDVVKDKAISEISNFLRRDNSGIFSVKDLSLMSFPDMFKYSIFSTKIIKLDLSCNKLESISKSIGLLYNIEELDISRNRLRALPNSFKRLGKLRKFNISSNKIKSLPKSMGSLFNLEELILGHNKLNNLPSTFRKLTTLRKIELSVNRFKSLPSLFSELRSLVDLAINYNLLVRLPGFIGSLTALQIVSASFNNLSSISQEVGNSTSLKTLNLANNRNLTCLPNEILDLPET
jgi:hypothetical protein